MADDIFDPLAGAEPFDLSNLLPQQQAPVQAPQQPQQQQKPKRKGIAANVALAAIVPLIAKSMGQAGVSGLMQGYQQAQAQADQKSQQEFQNQRLMASDQRAAQAQIDQEAARQQAIAQHQRDQAAAVVKDFTAKLAGAETKQQVDDAAQGFRYAASVLGLRKDAVEGLIAKAAPTPSAVMERQVKKVVANLKPEQVDQYLQGGMAITVPGQELPVPVDVWSKYVTTGIDPVTGKRTVGVKAPNTDKRGFATKDVTVNGRRILAGFDPDTNTYYAPGDTKTPLTGDIQEFNKPNEGPRDRFSVQAIINPDGTTGLVRVNLDSGEVSPVALPNGAGSGRGTDTERLSKAYLDRTTASDTTAVSFEQRLARLGPQLDVQLPNLMKSEVGQRYKQAEDEFINAALRRESGAAIQPSEYDRFERIYFVRIGDTAATIKQKQAARKRVIDGFRVAAANMGAQAPTPTTTAPGPNPFRH